MVSVRSCLLSRKKAHKAELLRFVWQAGQLIWDERQNLPGRGVYVSPEASMMVKNIALKAWVRALRLGNDEVQNKEMQILKELQRAAEVSGLNLKRRR